MAAAVSQMKWAQQLLLLVPAVPEVVDHPITYILLWPAAASVALPIRGAAVVVRGPRFAGRIGLSTITLR